MRNIPTSITEKQWQVMKYIVESQEKKQKSTKKILNGIFYVNN